MAVAALLVTLDLLSLLGGCGSWVVMRDAYDMVEVVRWWQAMLL